MKAMVAALLTAFMVLGAMAITPMQVQANEIGAPTGLSVSANTISWQPVANAAHYQVSIDGGATWSANISGTSFNLAPFIDSNGLANGEVVNVTVRAHHQNDHMVANTASHNWTVYVTTGSGTDTGQIAAPTNVRMDGNTLRWDAVTDNRVQSFGIFVGEIRVATATSNFWGVDFNLSQIIEGQSIQLSVVAEGGTNHANSPRSAAVSWVVTNAGLGAGPTISVTAEGLLTWTGAGAQIVRVYRGGTAFHTTTTAVTSIDLASINLGTGSHQVAIRFLDSAGANATNLSNSVNVNLTGQLPAPTGLTVSAGTLTWTAVPNAVGYRVYVGGTQRTPQNITGTSFNLATLNLASGNHNVQVRAIGNPPATQNSALSTGINFTPGAVATPTNVSITGTTLSWTAVSNAVGYRIYVDGTARTTGTEITATNFNLATLNLAVGTYEVQVRALGNGTTTHNSNLTDAIDFAVTVIQLEAPTGVNVQGTVLHWTAVTGARGYVIYIGGAVHSAPTTATHFALGALNLSVGHHNVQVRAMGDGEATQNSPLSTAVQFSVGATLPPTGDQPSLWARDMVTTAVGHGLVPQHLRSSFTQATTRAEFAALATALYETVMGYEIVGRVQFNDTNDPNVQKMGYMGVVLGIGYGNFAPNSPLTREQAATMIARLADAMGRPLAMTPAQFPDNASIAPWAIVQVGQMQGSGIMVGADEGRFMPQGPYTREQSIVTLLRLFDIVTR